MKQDPDLPDGQVWQVREPAGAQVLAGDASPEAPFQLIYFAVSQALARRGTVSGDLPFSRELIRKQALARISDFARASLLPALKQARRLLTPSGTLYLQVPGGQAHYAKLILDEVFSEAAFINEIIWAKGGDSIGADQAAAIPVTPKPPTRDAEDRRWPAAHDTLLMYAKDPKRYFFDPSSVDREPYMAPNLVTEQKRRRGKLPTDVWWHTLLPGGPGEASQAGIVERIVAAGTRPGDRVLTCFTNSKAALSSQTDKIQFLHSFEEYKDTYEQN